MLIMRAYSLADGAFFAFVSIIRRKCIDIYCSVTKKKLSLIKASKFTTAGGGLICKIKPVASTHQFALQKKYSILLFGVCSSRSYNLKAQVPSIHWKYIAKKTSLLIVVSYGLFELRGRVKGSWMKISLISGQLTLLHSSSLPPSIQTGYQIHPFVSCVYLMGGKVYLRVDLLVLMIEFWPLALVPVQSCIQASILERMTWFYTFMQLLQLLSYVARK